MTRPWGTALSALMTARSSAFLPWASRASGRMASSFASGLLIGADVAARLREPGDPVVHLIADAALGPLYAAAIRASGRDVSLVDSDAAFVAGAIHLSRLIA